MKKKPLVVLVVVAAVVGFALLFVNEVRRQDPDSGDAVAPTVQPGPVQVSPGPAPAAAQPSRPAPAPSAPAPADQPVTAPSKPDSIPTLVPEEQQRDAAAVLKAAAAAYANVKSMKADFTQSQNNPLLGRRTSSRGTVYQRQPDRFLMRFTQPEGDVIVSDGEYFWLYYPSVDAKQVMRSKATDIGGLDLQAQFIGDPTRRFTYTDQGSEDVNGRSSRVLTLVPREPLGYKSLKVWIDQRDNLVRRFELTMDNGVLQRFDLLNLQVNPTLTNDLFKFTPPAGARIVER